MGKHGKMVGFQKGKKRIFLPKETELEYARERPEPASESEECVNVQIFVWSFLLYFVFFLSEDCVNLM